MILGIPFLVVFGALTFLSLITTASLGVAMIRFGKDVFKAHRFFAFFTLSVAVIHVTLASVFFFTGNLI